MLKLVKGLQIITLFSLLTALSATLFSRTTHAIVVEPIVAIGILKLSVYFVGLLSVPITAFFQVVKGKDRKKAVIMSLASLAGIFLVSFIAFSLLRSKAFETPQRPQDTQFISGNTNKGRFKPMPSVDSKDPNFVELDEGRPVVDRFVYRVNPLDLAAKAFLVAFIVSSFALVVPLLVFLFILNKSGQRGWDAIKFILLLVLSDTILSTIIAYTLTVFLLMSQGFV